MDDNKTGVQVGTGYPHMQVHRLARRVRVQR
jgi:hypothetical protein